jgi:pimeloyl-ACP methyl ester carboxylesterase
VQPTSGFAYDEESYVNALDDFVQAVGLKGPFFVITHGFVLGQYGLLWALKRTEDIAKLVILGTPLSTNTKLRPELAPYKSPVPFLRPKPDAKFAGDLFNAAGLAYVISYDDAQVGLVILPVHGQSCCQIHDGCRCSCVGGLSSQWFDYLARASSS